MTTFVEMYHPALPGTPHVEVAQQAEALYSARGWLAVDGTTPPPEAIYLTPAVGDLRYDRVLSVAATATSSATLAANTHTPVDASSAGKTMTLPTGQPMGTWVIVEKVDTSANAVTISGSIRGSAGSEQLTTQYEARSFVADSSGSWHPFSGHKTWTALRAAFGSVQTHHSVAPFASFGQAPSGRTICGVDPTSGKVWSYNSGGLYQVDSLTATNWSAVTLPPNISPSGQAAKVVVWTPPGGSQPLMYLISWNTSTSRYECYSAPLVPRGTAPTWSALLFSYSANATLIPTAIRATSTGLYAGEYTGAPDISGGPSIHKWDGTTHTVALGPLAGARHIHSVYEDPFTPGTVYALIGDFFTPYTPPAPVYKSVGGAAFQAVTFANAPAVLGTLQGVGMGFTADYVWVASDQSQGGGPYVFTRDASPSWRWATMRSRQDKIAVPGGVSGRVLTDAALNSNTTMTSASGAFTANDVGKYVSGHNAIPIGTFIQSVQSATSVTLSQAATNTSTAQTVVISGDTFYANAYAGAMDPATGWFYLVANDASNAGNVAGIFVLTGLDKPFTLLWTLPLANIGNHEVYIAGGYLFVDRYGPLPLLAT